MSMLNCLKITAVSEKGFSLKKKNKTGRALVTRAGRWEVGEIYVGQRTKLKLHRWNQSRDPMYTVKTIVNVIILNTGGLLRE